jgi:hypothetical protein
MVERSRMAGFGVVAAMIGASWLGMMTAHELGHALAAWCSGGRVERIVLHPLAFSRTDLGVNPHPALVALGGFVVGALAPLGLWLGAHRLRWRCGNLLRFFAGFCLLANGAYLASAAVLPVGDTADLLRLGAPVWVMVLCGGALCAGGLALWSGSWRLFAAAGRAEAIIAWAALALLASGMLVWSWAT